VLLLLAGAALRLWQYLAKTSLWIDEIAVAENVIHAPLSSLLGKPLALDQVAPPGFLAALKGAVEIFGPNELALRLFPLLGGLAALVLFALLSRRVLAGWTAVFATALFALAPSLIAYSAEVKQYSSDVAATLLLTLVALRLRDVPQSRARLLVAGLIGMAAVWFSQPAVLTVAGLGAGLAWIALGRGGWPALRPLLPVLGLWAASAAAATALGLHSLTFATREYLQSFWEPSLPRPTVVALVLLGSAVLWKKRPQAAPLLVGPAAVALAAAAAHRYPFSGRAILFLMPVALLAAADASESLVTGLVGLRVPRPVGAALFAIALAVTTGRHLPVYRQEETRTVLLGLSARRQPGDVLYVYYGAERALRFYGPQVGIEPSEATFGGCHRGQPREYLRELDRFRGRNRVWVVVAHAISSLAEQPNIHGYLARIGTRREGLEAVGATAELYDLSDPERLQSSTAETYPLSQGNPELAARFACGHGPLAVAPSDWR
jgi:hypothetical protein